MWSAEWVPTTTSVAGCRRRHSYWVRVQADGERQVLLGRRGTPPVNGVVHFSINGDQVYREDGHPDGASSVPYLVIRRERVCAAEGFPTGPGSRTLFRIEAWRDAEAPVRIRRNAMQGRFADW